MRLRLLLALLVLILVAGAGVWLFGPREPARLTAEFEASRIGDDPAAYLARTEADIPNLRENAEKEIVWAYPASKSKTPLAIVYLHGFSAAKGETRPLADEVARNLGANLFFTRLTGHGRDSVAMTEATIGDWVDDAAEAMAIGRRLGERVIVIGSSTGATLGTLIASRPDLSADLAGLVALSPNYALQNWRSFLLTIPFARELIPYLGPATFGEPSESAAVNANWTVTYPTAALLPMARLAEIVGGLDFAAMRVPALFVYSPEDAVVDATRTVRVAGEWGAPHQTIEVPDAPGVARHIVAGDLISPATTERVAAAVTDWIRALPAR